MLSEAFTKQSVRCSTALHGSLCYAWIRLSGAWQRMSQLWFVAPMLMTPILPRSTSGLGHLVSSAGDILGRTSIS